MRQLNKNRIIMGKNKKKLFTQQYIGERNPNIITAIVIYFYIIKTSYLIQFFFLINFDYLI